MIRMFETHEIRKTEELSGKLWDFTPMEQGYEKTRSKVMVPSCIETYPGFGNYRGWACYETDFAAEGNICLVFKGVSHYAKVYVDGKELAQHYNSYTPFSVLVKGLCAGTHHLKVLADNEFREEYALDMPNDYMSYGGISRGVVLERISDAYIHYMHITPLKNKQEKWTYEAEILCENLTDTDLKYSFTLYVADSVSEIRNQILKPGKNKISLQGECLEEIQEWSPEHPVLYNARVTLQKDEKVMDDLIERIGFRIVEVNDKQILLNGKPLRIKGFCRHEDHPHYGCALPPQAIAKDLMMIKDMGGNSVRTSHYPNDELFLDMCDEMGILVWEENHARGIETERMKNPNFEKQCEQVIEEMITAHYNHPSIYIWGIMNECGSESEYGRSCYQAQFELIRELDKSRPCTYASCKFNIDICQDLPDVCSWNMYPYWYEEKTATAMAKEVTSWIEKDGQGTGKPFLVSEIGAGAIYGFRDTAKDVWSEELQAEILEKQIREILAYEECVGLYIWQFCDVRVSRISWAIRRPKSRNNKGIVDEYRRPKLAYEVVRKLFREIPNYKE